MLQVALISEQLGIQHPTHNNFKPTKKGEANDRGWGAGELKININILLHEAV